MPAVMMALLTVMTEMPAVVNGLQGLWRAFLTFHNAGAIKLTEDQLKAMNAAGVAMDAAIAKLDADAGPNPFAATPPAAVVAKAAPAAHFGS